MRSLTANGQRTTAIKYYDSIHKLLEIDLGVKPEAETIFLYEQIHQDGQGLFDLAESLQPGRLSEPGSIAGLRTRPVFVGRKKELSLLQAQTLEMMKGSGRVVLIAGDAGWGKTALIDAFTHHIRASHPNIITAFGKGNAYTGVGDPYLPFRDILEFLAGDVKSHWTAGAISQDLAYHVGKMAPIIAQIIMEDGGDLIDTFVTGQTLFQRATAAFANESSKKPNWLSRFGSLMEQKKSGRSVSTPLHQGNLFEQYSRVLRKIAQHAPMILVVDDMQWMDAGSASLLFHLVKRLENSRILLIGAYRPTDLWVSANTAAADPDKPEDSVSNDAQTNLRDRNPLEYVINELKRDGGNIEISLSQSEEGFVDALIDHEPNDLKRSFRTAFENFTHGHPLFAVELLQSMIARGGLVKDESGRLVEGEALDWEILPARVEAVIAERIARLPRRLLNVLKIACIEGEIFTAEIIAQVLGFGEDEIIRILSDEIGKEHRLVRAEGVRWQQGGQRWCLYRFDHFLFQKYLYNALDSNERAYWHGKIGSSLEGLYQGRISDIAVSLSWHFEKAENLDKAVQYLNLAGENATRVSANLEGIAQFSRALTLLASRPDTLDKARQEFPLQINLAIAILSTAGYADERVEKAFQRARDLCNQIGDNFQSFTIAWQLACFRVSNGDFITGGAMMRDLVKTGELAEDPLLIALGRWGLGWFDLLVGDYPSSRVHLEESLDLYNTTHPQNLAFVYSQDPGVAIHALLAFDLLALGYIKQARDHSRKAIDLARQIQHPFSLSMALAYAIFIFGFTGDNRSLLLVTDELISVTQKYGFTYWYTAGLFGRGWAWSRLGEMDAAIRDFSEADNILNATGIKTVREVIAIFMAEVLAQSGRVEEGLTVINQTIQKACQTEEFLLISEIMRVRGELLLKTQPPQTDLAEAAFLESIAFARQKEARFFELKTCISLARLWVEREKYDQAYSLLSDVYTGFTEGFDQPDFQEARSLLQQLERK